MHLPPRDPVLRAQTFANLMRLGSVVPCDVADGQVVYVGDISDRQMADACWWIAQSGWTVLPDVAIPAGHAPLTTVIVVTGKGVSGLVTETFLAQFRAHEAPAQGGGGGVPHAESA